MLPNFSFIHLIPFPLPKILAPYNTLEIKEFISVRWMSQLHSEAGFRSIQQRRWRFLSCVRKKDRSPSEELFLKPEEGEFLLFFFYFFFASVIFPFEQFFTLLARWVILWSEHRLELSFSNCLTLCCWMRVKESKFEWMRVNESEWEWMGMNGRPVFLNKERQREKKT